MFLINTSRGFSWFLILALGYLTYRFWSPEHQLLTILAVMGEGAHEVIRRRAMKADLRSLDGHINRKPKDRDRAPWDPKQMGIVG